MSKKVLMVGWHPDAVNYDKWPGLTAEKLLAGLEADKSRLNSLGFDTRLGFIRSAEAAVDDVVAALAAEDYDVVMIGAGVRRDDDHFLTFEALVNAVHQHAPKARIAFNTGPTDSDAAVMRWA